MRGDVVHQPDCQQYGPRHHVGVLPQKPRKVGEGRRKGDDRDGKEQAQRAELAPPGEYQQHERDAKRRRYCPRRGLSGAKEPERRRYGEELKRAVEEGVVFVEVAPIGIPGVLRMHAFIVMHRPRAEVPEAGEQQCQQQPDQQQRLSVIQAEDGRAAHPLAPSEYRRGHFGSTIGGHVPMAVLAGG